MKKYYLFQNLLPLTHAKCRSLCEPEQTHGKAIPLLIAPWRFHRVPTIRNSRKKIQRRSPFFKLNLGFFRLWGTSGWGNLLRARPFWLLFLAMKKSNESPRRSLVPLTHARSHSPMANLTNHGAAIPNPCGGTSRTAGQALALWQKSLAFLQRQSMAHQVTNHHALFGKSVSKTPILHVPTDFPRPLQRILRFLA